VGDDLHHGGAAADPAGVLGRPVTGPARGAHRDRRARRRPVGGQPEVADHQTQQVLGAALVDVRRVDVPEVVGQEGLDALRVVTEPRRDRRTPLGQSSALRRLLALELTLESCPRTACSRVLSYPSAWWSYD